VVLNGNLSSVTLARNEIKEAVTASGNTGGTKIAGNHIVGALECTTNTPPPNNFGLLNTVSMPNTVGGARTGQTCSSGSF
jgi:hypothetical protein